MRDLRFRKAEHRLNDTERDSLPLVFDVVGPFVIQFQQDDNEGQAIICAPLCPDHHANLLTDWDDISVKGLQHAAQNGSPGFVYRFRDGHEPTGATKHATKQASDIFRVRYDSRDPQYFLDPDKVATICYAVFDVPMPNRIVALRPEVGWVHRNGSDMWVMDTDYMEDGANPDIVSNARGRGLRLIYDECDTAPDFHLGPEGDANLRARTYGFGTEHFPIPNFYYITLRFAAAHATDNVTDDAHSCFQTMRALFDTPDKAGQLSTWRADFVQSTLPAIGTRPDLFHLSGDRPHDCGAMTIVMQDWDD